MALTSQRWADLEFKASLIYKGSSRTARVAQCDPLLKQQQKQPKLPLLKTNKTRKRKCKFKDSLLLVTQGSLTSIWLCGWPSACQLRKILHQGQAFRQP